MGDIATTLVLSLGGVVGLAVLLWPLFVRRGWPLALLAALTVLVAVGITLQVTGSRREAEEHQRTSEKKLFSKIDDLQRALSVGLRMPMGPTEAPPLPSVRAVQLAGLVGPNDGPYALALKATAERRFDDARRFFTRAQEDGNTDPRTLYAARADMEGYAGDYVEQIEWLQKGLALAPHDSELLLKKGVASMARGRFEEAKAPLEQAAASEDRATAALAQTTLACGYLRQGNVSEAKAVNDQALAAVSNSGDAYRGAVLTNAAGIADAMGDIRRAKELYLQALQLQSETCPEGAMRAGTLNGLGWLYDKSGNPREAERALESSVKLAEKCLREGPRLAELLADLGALYTDRKRYEDAEPLYKRALFLTGLSASPQRVTVLKRYRDFLRRAGRADEAANLDNELLVVEGNAPFQGAPILLPPPQVSSGHADVESVADRR